MIWKLRRKLILISTLSVLGALTVIFSLICAVGTASLNRTMDTLTDAIAEGKWLTPEPNGAVAPPNGEKARPDIMGIETRFSTRYFTVCYHQNGTIETDVEHIHAVNAADAVLFADAVRDGATRGWYGVYRYQVYADHGDRVIVFVDGSMNRAQTRSFFLETFAILAGSGAVILLLIVVFSRMAVKPVAESYEKQKQFITDANHELKTPLTLILTDVDIAETELGKNEWLDDMRTVGQRMAELVSQMVTLCRMDEAQPQFERQTFDLSETVADTASEFEPLALRQGKRMKVCVVPNLDYCGDEGAVRRLLSILLDNAVKYCDPSGEICVNLSGKRRIVLTIENDFAEVGETDLSRLFDRFYRSDRARTAGSGFGIGLSIAKATADAHRADLAAYRAGPERIGFKLILKGK